jgi:hypothetical protein
MIVTAVVKGEKEKTEEYSQDGQWSCPDEAKFRLYCHVVTIDKKG